MSFDSTPLLDRLAKRPTSGTVTGRMRPKRQSPAAAELEEERQRREAQDALQERYAPIQRQFQTALAANEPMILAMLASLADMMEGWFSGMQGFDEPNFNGDLMLVNTELAEACEADRNDAMSDKIPDFHGRDEELADALVRVLHMCGKYEIKIGPAFVAKMKYNLNRPFKHGKKY